MRNLTKETYRGQITRLVRNMTRANRQTAMSSDLASGSRMTNVKMFVDGNFEKRLDKLRLQLEPLNPAYENLEEMIVNYIREQPAVALENVTHDADRMLTWVCENFDSTPQQRDYIACQRARHAVEELGRTNRLKHIRFQELYSLTSTWLAEPEIEPQLHVHLNPIRVWSRFHTTIFLDEESSRPADVLFFAVGNQIHTAVLELEGQALINELADFQPCRIEDWAALTSQTDREELLETCRDLAEMGLVAFG